MLSKFKECQNPFKFGILIVLISALFLSFSVFPLYTFNEVNNTALSFGSSGWAHILQKSLQTRELKDIKGGDGGAVDCYLEIILPDYKKHNVIDFCPSSRWPTSVWKKFGNKDFKIGTITAEANSVAGLEGCTVVVILTKKGVWMAHFWEVPGFSRSPPPLPGKERDFKTDRFQQDVLDFIKNGIATESPDEDPPLKGDKLGKHSDDLQNSYIWILSPTPDGKSRGFNYPTKIQQLEHALKAQVGKATVEYLYYQKPEIEDDEEESRVIPVLFEYDPLPDKRVRLLYGGHPVGFDRMLSSL